MKFRALVRTLLLLAALPAVRAAADDYTDPGRGRIRHWIRIKSQRRSTRVICA